MGEILLEWARNIIFFMVFLSVISHLLADASYEKYIRFFAGIVLILITVSPLKGGLDFQEKAGSKRKSRGRSICKSGNSPCYNQRKAGKTRH